jgi:glycosyltransferase involved in cell wall biosynthesis
LDDGSTDNTENVVKGFQLSVVRGQERIRYIKKENEGVPKTRNKLIELAKSDYIFWIDSDDILMPNILRKFVKCMVDYPDVDVVYGNKKHFGYSDDEWIYPDYYQRNDLLIERLVFLPKVPQSSLFIKKAVYQKYGGYDPALIRLEDTDLWIRLCDKITFKHLNQYVLYYRIHDTNISGNIQLTYHTMDLSYNVTMLDRMLAKFSLQQLFTANDWSDVKNATAIAYIEIGKRYALFRDKEKSLRYYNKTMEVLGSDIKFHTLNEVYQALLHMFNEPKIAESHKVVFVHAGVWDGDAHR